MVHALLYDPRLTVGELARITQASEITTRSTLTGLVEGRVSEDDADRTAVPVGMRTHSNRPSSFCS